MAFDFKKEYKEFYLPPKTPGIVTLPPMQFLAVRGKGDPNDPDGDYHAAMQLLYGMAFTLKMCEKAGHSMAGYFPYVVPPLEGLWCQEGTVGLDYGHKERMEWISMIRLPDFVTRADFEWAKRQAAAKKKTDFSKVLFFPYQEGLCVQCMHLGSYDDEPQTLKRMHAFLAEQGYEPDFSDTRFHHELYLSDPRRTAPEKLRTVLRLPIRPKP